MSNWTDWFTDPSHDAQRVETVAEEFANAVKAKVDQILSNGIVPYFRGLDYVIGELLKSGENVIGGLIRLYQHITAKGFDFPSVMEKIVEGCMHYGSPWQFIIAILENRSQTIYSALTQLGPAFNTVGNIPLETIHSLDAVLAAHPGFGTASSKVAQGQMASTFLTQYTQVKSNLQTLSAPIASPEMSQAVNTSSGDSWNEIWQDFGHSFNAAYEQRRIEFWGFAVLDAFIFAGEVGGEIAVTAVSVGIVTIPAGVVLAGMDIALLAAEMDACGLLPPFIVLLARLTALLFSAVATLIAQAASLVGPEIHNIGTAQAAAVTIDAKLPLLAKEPSLSAEFDELAKELARSLGVRGKWIRAILNALPASMSAAKAEQVVRCLNAKGYFQQAFRAAWNGYTDHLTPQDIQGFWRDLRNIFTSADHLGEVATQLIPLGNLAAESEIQSRNPFLTASERQMWTVIRNACEDTKRFILDAMTAKDTHHFENDGWAPFAKDIVQGSGCLTATTP